MPTLKLSQNLKNWSRGPFLGTYCTKKIFFAVLITNLQKKRMKAQ